MHDEGEIFWYGFICACIAWILVSLLWVWPRVTWDDRWHKEAIEHKAAHFDPETGKFVWNQ